MALVNSNSNSNALDHHSVNGNRGMFPKDKRLEIPLLGSSRSRSSRRRRKKKQQITSSDSLTQIGDILIFNFYWECSSDYLFDSLQTVGHGTPRGDSYPLPATITPEEKVEEEQE